MATISSSVEPQAAASHNVKSVTETMTVLMAATNTTAVRSILLLHSFIHSFTHLFIHSSIHPSICVNRTQEYVEKNEQVQLLACT